MGNSFARPRRSILKMLALGFFALLFYKMVLLDQLGFCFKRLWFVSSEELILNHIDGVMKSGRAKLDAEDTSPKAYLNHHPNCCRVNRGGNPFLLTSAEVTVIYEMSDKAVKRYGSSTENYYETIAFDTACGVTLRLIGISTRAPVEFRFNTK